MVLPELPAPALPLVALPELAVPELAPLDDGAEPSLLSVAVLVTLPPQRVRTSTENTANENWLFMAWSFCEGTPGIKARADMRRGRRDRPR